MNMNLIICCLCAFVIGVIFRANDDDTDMLALVAGMIAFGLICVKVGMHLAK